MMTGPLFPRTYRMMFGVRAFMLAIAVLIMGVGAKGLHFQLEFIPPDAVDLLFFGVVAAGGVFLAHRSLFPPEITLARNSIEFRTTIARRELFKYEIAGYRLKERFSTTRRSCWSLQNRATKRSKSQDICSETISSKSGCCHCVL